MMNKSLGQALTLSLLASAISTTVSAQSNLEDWAIEEVVVTAQKRAQSAQDVPIALAAFSEDMLKQVGATDFKGLTNMTPGFSVSGSSDAFPSPYIRGVGSNDNGVGTDPSVGVYVDGIYVSRKGGALTDLLDVERVEILKGPQGTLFGRNSIGGAISITTQKPTNELSGMLSAEVGNYDSHVVKGMVNMPLIEDELFVRASGIVRKRDGWLENVVDGNEGNERDRATGNLKITWLPSEDLEIELANSWSRIDETGNYTETLIAGAPVSALTTDLTDNKVVSGGAHLYGNPALDRDPLESRFERTLRSHSLTINWDVNDELSFTSLSSYRTYETFSSGTYAGNEYYVGANEGATESNESISQEFRLNGSSDKLTWFVGLSGSHERNAMAFTIGLADNDLLGFYINGLAPFFEDSLVKTTTDSYALYGDATWHATDKLNVTFGARYSVDEKEISYRNPEQVNGAAALAGMFGSPVGLIMPTEAQFIAPRDLDDSWSNLSPRLVLDYVITEDMMAYASVTKGYKSGGFNTYPSVGQDITDLATLGMVTQEAVASVDPEIVTSYELGLKSTFLDGRVIFNTALFAYDYDDLQVFVINGAVTQLANAGKASAEGVEMDLTYHITPEWTVIANAAWTEATYDEFVNNGEDLSGTDRLFSPEWTGTLALDYHTDVEGFGILDGGEFRAFVTYAFKDDYLIDPDYEQESYGLVDARVSLTSADEQWEVAIYGSNLTNEDYLTSYTDQLQSYGFVGATRNEPRMFGASATYNF